MDIGIIPEKYLEPPFISIGNAGNEAVKIHQKSAEPKMSPEQFFFVAHEPALQAALKENQGVIQNRSSILSR